MCDDLQQHNSNLLHRQQYLGGSIALRLELRKHLDIWRAFEEGSEEDDDSTTGSHGRGDDGCNLTGQNADLEPKPTASVGCWWGELAAR